MPSNAPLVRPEPGKPLDVHPTYADDEQARRFWRASFRCGREYLRGLDAFGLPVLVPHEREEAQSYERRRRLAKPRNFVGPILRRYNDLVFRKPAVRPLATERPPLYGALIDDATGQREPLDAFMRRALLRAQIDREAWILLDRTGAAAPAVATTVAQVQAAGVRPVLRIIDAASVVNWREAPGGAAPVVAEAWALMYDAAGAPVCRMFDATHYIDAILKPDAYTAGTMIVAAYGPPVAHGFSAVPLVRLRPCFDPLGAIGTSEGDSQAGPLAESQQAIVNLVSLSREEVYNVTFSQMIAFGVSDSQVGDAKVGNNRVLCVPNPAGSVQMIGADPAQATSIRQEVSDEVANLFRLAGVNPADASTAPASGLALAFRHNDLATIVAALAMAVEQAEGAAWVLLAQAWKFELPAPTVYQGKDPELPDFAGEAQTMLAIVANAALPPTIRRKVAERFAARNLSLSEEEAGELDGEVRKSGALARAMGPDASPFPPGKATDELGDEAADPLAGEKVADSAMNGAQIASLVDLLASIAERSLAPEAAVLAITNAFPAIDEGEAARMVAAQTRLKAPAPAPGVKPGAEDEDPEDEDPEDDDDDDDDEDPEDPKDPKA